jgi:hypothetical protein
MGDGHFEHQTLRGVRKQAYTMAWSDLRGKGMLDLVTASGVPRYASPSRMGVSRLR